MKTIAAPLLAHYRQGSTSIATCWKVALTNEQVYGFTNHDRNLVVNGIKYEASAGFLPSAVQTQTKLAPDNLRAQGYLDSDSIVPDDLAAGIWDYAEVTVFEVNWRDVSQGVNIISRGRLGEVTLERGAFSAELRGLATAYGQAPVKVYSAGCGADFGDSRCGINLATFTFTGTLTAVSADMLTITDSALAQAADFFKGGKVFMLSGASEGLTSEVKEFAVGGVITLQIELPKGVSVGDNFTISKGCGKRYLEDCIGTYGNGINFRGFPTVPGTDRMVLFGGG